MSQIASLLVKLVSLGVAWSTAFSIGYFAMQQSGNVWFHAYVAISIFIGSLLVTERISGLHLNIGLRDKNAAPRKMTVGEPEAMVAGVWITALIIGHFAARPFGNMWVHAFIAIALFIGSLIASERILGLHLSIGLRDRNVAPRKAEAVETEALRLHDMIALLDDDDLDDLRAEVREGLRDRIRNLTADESETFEELLSDSKRKRR